MCSFTLSESPSSASPSQDRKPNTPSPDRPRTAPSQTSSPDKHSPLRSAEPRTLSFEPGTLRSLDEDGGMQAGVAREEPREKPEASGAVRKRRVESSMQTDPAGARVEKGSPRKHAKEPPSLVPGRPRAGAVARRSREDRATSPSSRATRSPSSRATSPSMSRRPDRAKTDGSERSDADRGMVAKSPQSRPRSPRSPRLPLAAVIAFQDNRIAVIARVLSRCHQRRLMDGLRSMERYWLRGTLAENALLLEQTEVLRKHVQLLRGRA